jgi:4-amino-4-deoxy-L-arabinose transferase-like glycosyltransferase
MQTADVERAERARRERGSPDSSRARLERFWERRFTAFAVVLAITAVGVLLRWLLLGQSLFADEISTYWIERGRSLGDVLSVVHTDAEITPPLYFAAAWLTTQIDLTPELLRAPSFVAGVATIPLVYLVGVQTVKARAAVIAATLTALSPFMIYYSTEARGYAAMTAFVLLSTFAMLRAVDGRQARWWVVYGAGTCAAVYSHYTAVFALAAQLIWLLWAHPEARRPALMANAAAVVAYLPWLSGLRGDLNSPTTDILTSLEPFDVGYLRASLEHWAIGHPQPGAATGLTHVPGSVGLVLIALGLALALAGVVNRRSRDRFRGPDPLDRRLVLLIAIAISTPVAETGLALLGSNLVSSRNLAASWPAFALCLAAWLAAARPAMNLVAPALVIGGFAIGAVKTVQPDFGRPDYLGAAAYIDRVAEPGDVVIDGASFSPAGLPRALDVAFGDPPRTLHLGEGVVKYDPFRILAPAPPTSVVVRRAAAAADGHRIFLALLRPSAFEDAIGDLSARYRLADRREFAGVRPVRVLTYERRP